MQHLHVNDWLCLAIGAVDEARQHFCNDTTVLVESVSSHQFSESIVSISNIGQFYWFAKFLDDAKAQSAGSKLVLCTGVDAETITACSFLVGAYLILVANKTKEEVDAAFEPIAGKFQAFRDPLQTMSFDEGLTTADGWRALHQDQRLAELPGR